MYAVAGRVGSSLAGEGEEGEEGVAELYETAGEQCRQAKRWMHLLMCTD